MGSGLGRIGIKNSIILDMIITAILEEIKDRKITNTISIVLPRDKSNEINLKNHAKNWK
jgi:hypothetical protein